MRANEEPAEGAIVYRLAKLSLEEKKVLIFDMGGATFCVYLLTIN